MKKILTKLGILDECSEMKPIEGMKCGWYCQWQYPHGTWRFWFGKCFGKWVFNVGLYFIDFGYAW